MSFDAWERGVVAHPDAAKRVEKGKRALEVIANLTEDDQGGLCFAAVGSCWVCGGPTHRVEINFQAHLHYGRCNDFADRHFWHANRRDERGDFLPIDENLGHQDCSLCGTQSIGNN